MCDVQFYSPQSYHKKSCLWRGTQNTDDSGAGVYGQISCYDMCAGIAFHIESGRPAVCCYRYVFHENSGIYVSGS